jgi:DNA helicase TIP49 (TBP-interacting protein)
LTGLSGAGKTTIAQGLAQELQRRNYPTEVLDGTELFTVEQCVHQVLHQVLHYLESHYLLDDKKCQNLYIYANC